MCHCLYKNIKILDPISLNTNRLLFGSFPKNSRQLLQMRKDVVSSNPVIVLIRLGIQEDVGLRFEIDLKKPSRIPCPAVSLLGNDLALHSETIHNEPA